MLSIWWLWKNSSNLFTQELLNKSLRLYLHWWMQSKWSIQSPDSTTHQIRWRVFSSRLLTKWSRTAKKKLSHQEQKLKMSGKEIQPKSLKSWEAASNWIENTKKPTKPQSKKSQTCQKAKLSTSAKPKFSTNSINLSNDSKSLLKFSQTFNNSML